MRMLVRTLALSQCAQRLCPHGVGVRDEMVEVAALRPHPFRQAKGVLGR